MTKDKLITMEEFKGRKSDPEYLKKMREALDRMKTMTAVVIESEIEKAKITKAKYDALIAEGFNERQALELCKG